MKFLSMAKSTLSRGLTMGLYVKNLHDRRRQTFSFNPIFHLRISEKKDGCHFPGNRSLLHLSTNGSKSNMEFAVNSSVPPGAPLPLPSEPPSGSWNSWIVAALMAVILPFLSKKWGPLLKLKQDVETVVETADNIAEVVEKVAEEVEKIAEDVADDLPEGGQLRNAVTFVENLAKETAKDAELVEEFIDKVEDVEEKVESFVESLSKEANDIENEETVRKEVNK